MQQLLNKNAIFTIVTKNYIGIATVLGESIRRHHKNVDFFVLIADEIDKTVELPENGITYIEAKSHLNINEFLWFEMAFKYNLVEFCTAIKPFCFSYLFNNSYNSVIYLDPDIYIFSPLDDIFDHLKKYKIVLTPHITTCDVEYSAALSENEFLNAGVYNCGFVGISHYETTKNFIDWWQRRLMSKCFSTPEEGLFTDQKWMSFVSCFFNHDEYYIERSLGYNIAPWNYFEREILTDETGAIFIQNRITKKDKVLVCFVHYSGYDYRNIDTSRSRYFSSIDYFEDLEILFPRYQDALSDPIMKKYLDLTYSYNNFSNGVRIDSMHRRLFRRLLIEGEITNDNPFSVDNSFYKQLSNRNMLYHDSSSLDKLKFDSETSIKFEGKILLINKFFSFLFFVLGFKKFSLLVKFFSKYFRYENFIFIYDKKLSNKSFNKNYLP